MQSFHLKGNASMDGGEYSTLKVSGMGKCTGNLKAMSIDIDGSFTCLAHAEAGTVVCDGLARFEQGLRVGTLDVDGSVTIGGGKLEADEILCDGMIKADGEVSADSIRASGAIFAKEIVGDKIIIDSFVNKIAKFVLRKNSEIELIEATTITISGVQAKQVNGMIVKIGPGCNIETVDCSGTLSIHKDAKVGNITGKYTQNKWV